jgi:5-methylthioadenosine/S-adenosylhomocysteine deaminase
VGTGVSMDISEREYLVRGAHVVADAGDPDSVLVHGAVHIRGDRVAAIDSFDVLHAAHPALPIIGTGSEVVLPGLINAHDHGRSVSTAQGGLPHEGLESWMLSLGNMPPVDPYLAAAYASTVAIESGITTVVNNWFEPPLSRYQETFSAALAGHTDAGIRSVWVLQILDRSPIGKLYGDCLPSLPPELAAKTRLALDRRPGVVPHDYFQFCDEVARDLGERSSLASLQCGPVSAHWCSDGLLEQVAAYAAGAGLWMQTHLLESPLQARTALETYNESMVAHLARIGFLGSRLSCAHCVWVTESDIELLASAGASVVHCPGSNLRLASGIAPVAAMRAAGINVALGLDSNTLNDNGDPWQELRLAAHLHRQPGENPPGEPLEGWLGTATVNGARALGMAGEIGVLAPGAKADVILVSLERIAAPWSRVTENPLALLLARAEARDVESVIIDGRLVMEGRRLLTIDKRAIVARIGEQIRAAIGTQGERSTSVAMQILPSAARVCRVPASRMGSPYYRVNSKETL